MAEFELDRFDYDDLPKYPVICNLGKRRSGKTNLTRDQCYYYFYRRSKYPRVLLFSPTGSFNDDYDFVPPDSKFDSRRRAADGARRRPYRLGSAGVPDSTRIPASGEVAAAQAGPQLRGGIVRVPSLSW